MSPSPTSFDTLRRRARLACALVAGLMLAAPVVRAGDAAAPAEAAALQQHYARLAQELQHNAFGRPLNLESNQSARKLTTDVYALLAHPFAAVSAELQRAAGWCEILILHPNTKYCRPSRAGGQTLINMNIGRKADQAIEQSYPVDFVYRVTNATADYLAVTLRADKGPFGTHDYQLLLEAVPLRNGQTFLHLGYSYGYGTTAKLALLAYLATAGRNKVGFTVTGHDKNGDPVYVEGLRAAIERNTMRYYLAIVAYLDSLDLPPAEQFDRRLLEWYAASDHYARQLHEISRAEYLAMKRKEYQRQQAAR